MEILIAPCAVTPYSCDEGGACGGFCDKYDACDKLDCVRDCNFYTEH